MRWFMSTRTNIDTGQEAPMIDSGPLSKSFWDEYPAILGGSPAFADGHPFMRPTLPDWMKLADSIQQSIASGMLTKGHHLEIFEEKVARYLGVREAVAVSSCTTGLMLVHQSLGLEGEVIVPSFTFMATVHSLMWQGVKPIFVDVDASTWNIDPDKVEAHITPRTSAIVAVHVFGNPAPVEKLETIAQKHNLCLICDAAHGFGALHNNVPVGGYGEAEVFSTSPTKLLVTGEGGIVATNNSDLAERIRVAREYGNPGNYDSLIPGINGRMSEISAILGVHSLHNLEANAQMRNRIVARYISLLAELPGVVFQVIKSEDRSSYKDFTIRINASQFGIDRNALKNSLAKEGISTRTYYDPPVHRQTAYRDLVSEQKPDLPVTEALAGEVLSLPIFSHMPVENIGNICNAIQRIQKYAEPIRGRFNTRRNTED